jgi:DNA-directed RNA polymerase specialized sigma24 family protein
MKSSETPVATAEDVMAQSVWLRRLARGLLRDDDASEDAVQDMLAARAAVPMTEASRERVKATWEAASE